MQSSKSNAKAGHLPMTRKNIIALSMILTFIFLLLSSSYFTLRLNKTIKYTVEDTLDFKRIMEVKVANDDRQVAFIAYEIDLNSTPKKWVSFLYLKNRQGKLQELIRNEGMTNLNWSRDNDWIAYLAKGKKYQSIWKYDLKEEKAEKIFEFSNDILGFTFSPDQKKIAFLSENKSNDQEVEAESCENAEQKVLKPVDVEKIQSNVKLYLLELEADYDPSEVVSLTNDNVSVTGDLQEGFDWSPDSQMIVYAFQPKPGAAYINQNKIALVSLQDKSSVILPYTEKHTGLQPVFSPDGQFIAFKSNLEPSEFATSLNNNIALNSRVCVFKRNTGETHCLQNTRNESPVILGWNQAGSAVIVMDSYKTLGYQISALDINPAVAPTVISNVSGFIEPLTITLNDTRRILGFGYEKSNLAPQAYVSAVEPFHLQQISDFSNDRQNQNLGSVEEITWMSSDGQTIEGLLVKPFHYDPKLKYPVLVLVHGGPAGAWAKRYLGGCDEYGQMIEPSSCVGNYLSQGFVVFQPNPRGSTGYGRAFRLANFADFGGKDYQDIMAGLEVLIQKNIADPNHMAIAGWSFGGYMTTWAIGQTDRFKAAVSGDGNTDFISFTGTSDIPNYYSEYLGSVFLDNPKLYLERSPIMYAKKINTPLLILSGAQDQRVPMSQSYELYTALKQENKTVKMLIFPEQGHVPKDPNIIAASIEAIVEWIKKYTFEIPTEKKSEHAQNEN